MLTDETLSEFEGLRGTWEPNAQDRRSPAVEEMAAKLAWDRGGQTTPLDAYDLDRAEEIVTGENNLRAENERLRKALEPFARMVDNIDSVEGAMGSVGVQLQPALKQLADNCRAARTALTGEPRT